MDAYASGIECSAPCCFFKPLAYLVHRLGIRHRQLPALAYKMKRWIRMSTPYANSRIHHPLFALHNPLSPSRFLPALLVGQTLQGFAQIVKRWGRKSLAHLASHKMRVYLHRALLRHCHAHQEVAVSGGKVGRHREG